METLYTPFPKQQLFHDSTAQNRLFGGAAGGGKSAAFRMEVMRLLMSAPGIEGGVFRKTYPELDASVIRPLLSVLPPGSYTYNETKHRLAYAFPNGGASFVQFGHAQYDKDVFKHQGSEFDFLGFDELTLFNEFQFRFLKSRLRSSKPWVRPCLFATANPGNIGHAFVKRLWIDKELDTADAKETWEFIPATVYDNRALLDNDPGYVARLEALPDAERKAMLHGDWDSFAGQYFKEWRRDVHVCAPFKIPREWRKIVCLDYGFSNPSAILWIALDRDGNAYVYREVYETGLLHRDVVQKIVRYTDPDDEILEAVIPDPALRSKSPDTGTSFFDVAKQAGLSIIPGNNDRLVGWNVVRGFLKVKPGPLGKDTARLHVFSTCSNLIRTLPGLIYSKYRVEDCDSDGEDHAPDGLRYGLSYLDKNAGSLMEVKHLNDVKRDAKQDRNLGRSTTILKEQF